jgi:hypothetical protein
LITSVVEEELDPVRIWRLRLSESCLKPRPGPSQHGESESRRRIRRLWMNEENPSIASVTCSSLYILQITRTHAPTNFTNYLFFIIHLFSIIFNFYIFFFSCSIDWEIIATENSNTNNSKNLFGINGWVRPN